MKILWIDLETTGVSFRENKITELACLYEPCFNPAKEIEESNIFHKYIKYDSYPENYKTVSDITGLTPEILLDKGISESEAYLELMKFLDERINKFNKQDKALIAGYNVGFDDTFLRTLFSNNNNNYYGSYIVFPKLDIASVLAEKMALRKLHKINNFKLVDVASVLGLEFQAHSAIDDIKTTRKIFCELIKF